VGQDKARWGKIKLGEARQSLNSLPCLKLRMRNLEILSIYQSFTLLLKKMSFQNLQIFQQTIILFPEHSTLVVASVGRSIIDYFYR
jgi:hypothetical protein